MQSTMFKSVHHSISTLACLALAGTLAACGGGGGDGTTTPTPNGGANTPTITFAKTSTEDRTQIYAGVSGGAFANAATVAAKGKCTVLPTLSYSSVEQGTGRTNPDKVEVDTSGVVTYYAAGSYTIKATTQADTSGDSVCDAANASYALEVTKANASLAFDSTTDNVAIGGVKTTPAILGGVGGDSNQTMGGTISYARESGDATVDTTTGTVTAGDNTGDVRIYAAYSGSANYKPVTGTDRASYTLNISNAVPIITFRAPQVTADYAGADPGGTYTQVANVTAGSQCKTPPGATYSIIPDDASKATVHQDTGEVTYKAAGTYIITASTADVTSNSSVCKRTSNSYTLKVNKATATLVFDRSTDIAGAGGGTLAVANLARLGDTTGDDPTTDNMGGRIRYFSTNEALARVDASGTVTTLYNGTDVTAVVIYASYTGSNNYNNITGSATTKPHYTLSIGKNILTISFNGLSNDPTSHDVTYGGARGVEITSITADVSGVDANGFCPTAPAIVYSSIDTNTDGTTDKITFSDVTPGAITYKAAGSYRITATTAVTPGCGTKINQYTLNVAKANPGFSFVSSTTSVLPGATNSYSVNLTGVGGDTRVDIGGTINYSSADTAEARVDANSGEVTAGNNTGDVLIYATYSGSSNYNDATAGYTLNISNNSLTISFTGVLIDDTTSRSYAGVSGGSFTNDATVDLPEGGECKTKPTVTYTSSGGRPGSDDVSVNASTVTYKAAGTYTIKASTADTTSDSSVCDAASAQYTLIVNQATADLTFDSSTRSVATGGGTAQYQVSLSGTGGDESTDILGAADGGTITYSSDNTSIASVDASGTVTSSASLDVTPVVIYASLTNSNNYRDITGVNRARYTLNISNSAPTISFAKTSTADRTQIYAGASPGGTFTNDATATANGQCTSPPAPSYSSSDVTNASVDAITGDVTYTAAGSYTITARTPVAPGCAEADATYDLTVNKATPTIEFTTTTTRVAIGETVSGNLAGLTGVGSDPTEDDGKTLDGASISYSAAPDTSADVDNTTGVVTGKRLSSTGGVTITARYPGSDNYNQTSDEYQLTVTLTPADLATVDGSPIKKLVFSWLDVTDAAFYKLFKVNPNGVMNTQVGDVSQGLQSITHIVPLFASAGTKYRLASCDSADTCVDSTNNQPITQAQLNRAIGYIKASNTGSGDQFGASVSLSADGTTLAVGAIQENSNATGVGNNKDRWGAMNNDSAIGAGAVYVFSRTSNTSGDWSQQAYIKASNTGSFDQFGYSLSLSAAGTTLAVGANQESSNATGVDGGTNYAKSGAVYVFSRTSSTSRDWTQDAYIKASNTGGLDYFGQSLSLSAAGTTLAVGAYREDSSADGVGNDQDEWDAMDNAGAPDSGAVYVFSRSTTTNNWSQQAYIKASNTGKNYWFGTSLSLDASGTTLAVGANLEDSDATGVGGNQSNNRAGNSGAVYVFSRNTSGWTQQAYIKASNTGGDDQFGQSLSLSAAGTTLAVGAWGEDSSADGVGNNQDEWTAMNNNNLETDGDGDDGDAGAVYVFTRPSSTSRDWTQDAYIKASNTDKKDWFGWNLSLSADGATLAVGAHQESSSADGVGGHQDGGADYSGAVYVFSRSTTTNNWSQQAYIKASNTGGSDEFGWSLSLDASGDTLAVGARYEGSDATGIGGDQSNDDAFYAGAVYLY